MLLSVIAFVVVFGLIVLVHELGHFFMARRCGITVKEFGFGYPPRVRTLAIRNGVEYTLNAIPLGGFVRMLGEEDPGESGSFASKSAGVRIGTLLAGPLMNLVLAAVLFSVTFAIGDQVMVGRVMVQSVVPGSPADQAGLRQGDLLMGIAGQQVDNVTAFVARTNALKGQVIELSVLREDQQLTTRLTPRSQPPPGEGALGIVITMQPGYQIRAVRHPIWEATALGIREVGLMLALMIGSLINMFRVGVSAGDVAGPVGIFQMSGAVARTGIVNLMRFTALLSVNLFILNLLPLPALDGGRIAFVLLEKLRRGKRIAPQREGLVHLIGLALILALTVVFSYFDILRILSGTSPLP